jgi:O-antigen ligase
MHKEQMVSGKNLKKEGTKEKSTDPGELSPVNGLSLLPAKVEWCVLALCSCLFLVAPLYYVSLTAKGNWQEKTPPLLESIARKIFSLPLQDMPDLIPVRTVNAEYKLVIFLALASVVIGIVLCALHLKKRLLCIPKPLLIFAGLFLGSVFLSSVFAHNFQRAWVSSLLWHFVPVLFALALAHVRWTRKKTAFCLSSLLVGGTASCLIVMDQHYRWTEWSHGLPRTGYGGLIYNQNFAAEYHAPLLPLALSLIFFVRSIGFRIALGLVLAFVFLPALVLSLARGAWVGLMGGCFLTSVSLLVAWLVWRKKNPESSIQPKSFIPPGALLALGLALPLYIYTSDYWKKDAFSESAPSQTKTASKETNELKSITEISNASGGTGRRLVLWEDALLACLSTDLLLGKGTDHYELHFHESAKLSDKTTGRTLVRFVHNDFIQTLYENGLIGLIGFLGIWVWILWKGARSCLNQIWEGDLRGVGLRLGLVSGCLVFLIESFFEFPTRSPCALMVGWTTFGILLGILLQEKTPSDESSGNSIFQSGPGLNLTLGALGVLIIPYGCLLAKDLFWTNLYHVQGRVAGDYGEKDKSLSFHRKAISHAPWEHHSRKFECYYLLTHTKQIPQAIEAIEKTLDIHPGCLVAHRNKIAVYLNSGRVDEARKAHFDMKKAAPFHPFTENEGKRIPKQK